MEVLKQKFSGMLTLKSQEFLKVFERFNKDGNGYVEAAELDELMSTMLKQNYKCESIDVAKVQEAKKMMLEIADNNYDGKIDMCELAALLLPKECFLAQFQSQTQLSPTDFMKIWHHYDSNWDGYIDGGEIKAFVFDLLSTNDGPDVSPQRVDDYANGIFELFDKDKDGRFSFDELGRILPVVDNFLNTLPQKDRLSDEEFKSVYAHYDEDGSGYIEGLELKAFVKDMTEVKKGMVDVSEVDALVKNILAIVDSNKDGKVDKEELRMICCGKH